MLLLSFSEWSSHLINGDKTRLPASLLSSTEGVAPLSYRIRLRINSLDKPKSHIT